MWHRLSRATSWTWPPPPGATRPLPSACRRAPPSPSSGHPGRLAASLSREYVVPDDIKAMVVPVLEHRLGPDRRRPAGWQQAGRHPGRGARTRSRSRAGRAGTAEGGGRAGAVLTRRGWSMAFAVVALIVAGRLFGLPELYALAVAAAAAVGGALLYVRYYPWEIEAVRDVRPPQVAAHGSSRVELSVRNVGTRRSPVLSARDPFDNGRRWARFNIAPLEVGELVRAAYRLPTGSVASSPSGRSRWGSPILLPWPSASYPRRPPPP